MKDPKEPISQFESRKSDHIDLALKDENEASGGSGLEQIRLIHEALPELDFEDISLKTHSLGLELSTPFLVSSMTAGHAGGVQINQTLAKAASQKGWLMGVGSQRKELFSQEAAEEWKALRKVAPKLRLLGNLGLAQLIQVGAEPVKKLIEDLEASAMIIHLNALQECLQSEGTPHFKGGLKALLELSRSLPVPVVVKETGCGMSERTLSLLKETGVQAVDVSGYGGTHWGRIEGDRSAKKLDVESQVKSAAAESFQHWGISTKESLQNALKLRPDYEIWASGGVRTGHDAARVIAMGARIVGFAKPLLQAALKSDEDLVKKMETIEYELKVALFCTGSENPETLTNKRIWVCRQS